MTRVLQVDTTTPSASAVAEAVEVLRRGGLVAFPTETVYGLGAHALDATAVARIFEAKGRPSTDPVIVHVKNLEGVALIAREVPDVVRALAERFWPGPLTVILPKRAEVPSLVTAGLDTVGVRVPAHPVALALLERSGLPIAAPSANRFSRPSPTRAEHVLDDLQDRIDLVLDGGPTPVGVESTIVDLTVSPPLIRRPGGVSLDVLRSILRSVQLPADWGQTPRKDLPTEENSAQVAPGQMLRHYAPRAPLTLYEGEPGAVVAALGADARRLMARGQRVGVLAPAEDLLALAPMAAAGATHGRFLAHAYGSRRDPALAARELFASVRALDAENVDCILASCPAGEGIGLAIRDRLTRAAEGKVRKV